MPSPAAMAKGNQKGTVLMCSQRSTGLADVPASACRATTAITEMASKVQMDGPAPPWPPVRPGPFASATKCAALHPSAAPPLAANIRRM